MIDKFLDKLRQYIGTALTIATTIGGIIGALVVWLTQLKDIT